MPNARKKIVLQERGGEGKTSLPRREREGEVG